MGATSTMGKVVENVIAAAGGAFIARTLEANIPAPTDATKTDLRPYAGIVAGVAAVYFGKKDWQKAAGFGMIGQGTMALIPEKSIPKILGSAVPTSIGAPSYIRIPNRMRNQRRIAGNGQRFNVVGMNRRDGF